MILHYLDDWKQYLTDNDYNYLIQYIENIKNNISNNKMIILYGPGRTGKSTLKNNILEYLGDETCGTFIIPDEIIYNKNIKKLEFFCGIHEISNNKKNNIAIVNLIKYKQSIIAETNNIEVVDKFLLELSKIIQMEHIF